MSRWLVLPIEEAEDVTPVPSPVVAPRPTPPPPPEVPPKFRDNYKPPEQHNDEKPS